MFNPDTRDATNINSIIVICILLFGLLAIAGCSTNPPTEVIVKTETSYKTVPKHLLQPCPIPKPVDKQVYLAMDFIEKENWLTSYSIELMKSLGLCNNQIKAIEEFDEKHNQLYNK